MDSAGKNGSEDDPKIDAGAPKRAGQRAEDRAETGNVQELDQEHFPCRQRHIVNAVIDADRRRRLVCRAKYGIDDLPVDEIPDDEDYQRTQKGCHENTPLLFRLCGGIILTLRTIIYKAISTSLKKVLPLFWIFLNTRD